MSLHGLPEDDADAPCMVPAQHGKLEQQQQQQQQQQAQEHSFARISTLEAAIGTLRLQLHEANSREAALTAQMQTVENALSKAAAVLTPMNN